MIDEFLAVLDRSKLNCLEAMYPSYTSIRIAVKFKRASPQTHHVPHVNLPQTEPEIKVMAVKITPDFAFATAKESNFEFFETKYDIEKTKVKKYPK